MTKEPTQEELDEQMREEEAKANEKVIKVEEIGAASIEMKDGERITLNGGVDMQYGIDIETEEDDPMQSESIAKLSEALAKAQGAMENAKKESEGYQYNYADLAEVIRAAKKPLADNGLAVTQKMRYEKGTEGTLYVITTLSHSSGEWIRGEFPIRKEWIESKNMSLMQALGSVITYARRYSYSAMVGLAQEDNDAAIHRGIK